MKNIALYFAFILFAVQMNLSAQNTKKTSNYTYLVREETGDLNNDGRKDKLTVKMDTTDATRPLMLQILLSQPNKKLTLAVSSTKIIEPQLPAENHGAYNGYQIPDFFIENGILTMWSEIKNGNITYDFKYQNGNFELINVKKLTNNATQGYTDENTLFTEATFNLITGTRIETNELLGSDKVLSQRKKTIIMRPLPKIQDFKFSDKNLF
ncbi:hypothetical protein [Flavobacterium muglaense]|uniref:VCBS repeat-containing protein n=1 Tax=Flavobacterium muglaense TaxID=2764716 RepID=A0A923MYY6_9FLAO|nr:hypothetical protein [Flavobacterium muglaense]MBC5837191.1 hypothetical protein [Flavobacterium muglaense]MBC5843720.1 hypothetical protein [Flavobacterium muglaense]